MLTCVELCLSFAYSRHFYILLNLIVLMYSTILYYTLDSYGVFVLFCWSSLVCICYVFWVLWVCFWPADICSRGGNR